MALEQQALSSNDERNTSQIDRLFFSALTLRIWTTITNFLSRFCFTTDFATRAFLGRASVAFLAYDFRRYPKGMEWAALVSVFGFDDRTRIAFWAGLLA